MADLSSLEARADDAERRLAALEIAAKGSGSNPAASRAKAAPQGLQQQLQRLHQTLLSAKKEQLRIEKELAEANAAVEKRDYRIKFLQRTVREEESKLVEALQATPDQLAKLREQHAHRLQSA